MRQIMKRDLVEEKEKSEENEPAEKRELNADALVVIEEVKKDVLVEEEKQSEEEVGLLAGPQLSANLRVEEQLGFNAQQL
jgi:hypothetical protein